jgi:hypothetical protein
MACKGNRTQACGGSGRMSLYGMVPKPKLGNDIGLGSPENGSDDEDDEIEGME